MHVITFKRFREHIKKHPDSENALSVIEKGLKRGHFDNVNQAKDYFPKVSILNNSRVVIDFGGNKYRLVLKFNFKSNVAYVRFIGTHAEYDKIDANKI
ncbi:MAG: type II toxin-antitoxin system HigB family toxin [Desulfobacterales bacterium]